MFERSQFTIKRKYKDTLIFLLVHQKSIRILSFVVIIFLSFITIYSKLMFVCFNTCLVCGVITLEIKRNELRYSNFNDDHLLRLIDKKELEALINHKPEIKYNNSFTILEYYYNLKKDRLEYERIMFEDI